MSDAETTKDRPNADGTFGHGPDPIDPGFYPKPPAMPRGRGRPKGTSNRGSKQPSAIAQAFAKAGLDWKLELALAIKANNRFKIKLWLKLLPYMVTTCSRTKAYDMKGKPSKAAMKALDALERGE